jgi:hypothetical protein
MKSKVQIIGDKILTMDDLERMNQSEAETRKAPLMESYVTGAGTLVIPTPENTDPNHVNDEIDKACERHNLDHKKVTGIKNWGKCIAIHF